VREEFRLALADSFELACFRSAVGQCRGTSPFGFFKIARGFREHLFDGLPLLSFLRNLGLELAFLFGQLFGGGELMGDTFCRQCCCMSSLRLLKRCREVCELPLELGFSRALQISERVVLPFGRDLGAPRLLG